jgi:c(7)-type cytochrome triheme protein
MRYAIILLVLGISIACAGLALAKQGWYDLPEVAPPLEYGNILITRATAGTNVPAVSFSHWRHRLKYTCRVCHLELGFWMETNTTEITAESNRNGEYCGACHNGKTAFGYSKKRCRQCHNGNIAYGKKKSRSLRRLPRDWTGNRVDWSKAIRKGRIAPVQSIMDDAFAPLQFGKEFEVKPNVSRVPPAVFTHKPHSAWLDCANCHPDTFRIQKNSTESVDMAAIIDGKFCGLCHLKIAFPLDDCKRCHPTMRRGVKQ